ncbi:MAG TPA: bifunctional 4-hydroxy-2-oxoglutarate aldolase/2-dehydro-3-deoxy-phosphogluconate aldolase [Candidatus Baltobacteraceae bacterium]|nr:bifunctional 4-hydroxy-2-oxoglutarate aldolase/2-dehydro-3-deoxy-phosphogluconate aldolase [Candidatus Baltobacteraceae bacterium]
MNVEEIIRRIGEIGIVPVIRAANAAEASRAVEAVCAGGIPVVEITMTVPDAPRVLREVARANCDLLIGAGTVLDAKQAEVCIDAGAQFLVSPGLAPEVIHTAAKHGVLAIPGAFTPTEVMAAKDLGVNVIKIFPCGSGGGPGHIKALRAPFPDCRFIPTGGVNLKNAEEYFAAGAFALGIGAELADLGALRRNEAHKLTEAAKLLAAIVHKHKAQIKSHA